MDKFRSLVHGLIGIFLLEGFISCNQISDEDFQTLCFQRCPFQNKTEEHFDVGCGSDCKIGQCTRGCQLWKEAKESSCQTVCNGTQSMLTQKELYCVMGCNDAINQYFQKLKEEIGIPPAPYLVADTLTATSLSLAWEGARYSDISYLVQWRYEEHAGAWQYCRNQSWGPSNVALVEDLQPYTKYRFRVALLLSHHSEPIVSEPSVVISTLAAGIPSSPPVIIRATAIDSKRISVSWKPGPFPNGPIHSYVLELVGEYTALKEDIPATKNTDFYMFQNLNANSKYVISISMRNAVGEGPTATAEISTPPEPLVKDTLQPILILGSKHRVIRQGADMMLDVPVSIYESSDLITGIGIHINKNLLFVSDASGYVSVTSLREYSESKYVLTPADTSFKPLDLSVDWLNQHLYILGEVSHNKGTMWQVARCTLEGRGLTVAVAGITNRPLHIEVDPYNGYLFWLIQGHNRGGLYRLDLANISNGIKHEVLPDVILEDPHLGAFIVDHTNFCILIPNHAKNTVYSVSLDGREVTDLRANTQQPKFQNVLSLAIANGLFYWTDGDEILTEDYHEEKHTYFHNHYLGSKNRSYISVSIDLPTSQPIPVPVNPPIHVQAVLGGHVAKTTWQIPHLVGGQGKGAWQNWSYELQIKNEKTGRVKTYREISNSTFFSVEDLEDDTEYVIKAAAYTSSGSGPWSSEFRGKTLKTPTNGRYPVILWSAAEGLLESDVTGDRVETLISQENLKDSKGNYHFVDISWYKDELYLVTNTSKVHMYNLTSHKYVRIHNLDSVGSIAVDWIGKKLYWSNPKQQLIKRSNIDGSGQEPLPILTIAKELNIDSEHAFIYWSTGHAVECARLNGDARRVYYAAELFSGKQVMGLTLNIDDRHAYWIVRSNEGSNLYKTPMADSNGVTTEEIEPIKVSSFQHANMQGPLCYFSDHLLWSQDNKNAVIGDLTGQNAAVISSTSLSGLIVVAVMDSNSYLNSDGEICVIPDNIDESSIQVVGTTFAFNVTWDPVTNVNYGQVFYELTTEGRIKPDSIITTDNVLAYKRAEELPPYSEIRITLQAFTYWGSSTRVKKILRSPPSPPSVPTDARVFVNSHRNATTGRTNIVAVLRWNSPKEPNGPITKYRINWGYKSGDIEKYTHIFIDPDKLEYAFENLLENTVYYFQIQAFTPGGEGKYSKPIRANTSTEMPVPTLLVVAKDSINIIDCDSHMFRPLTNGDVPIDVSFNIHEKQIYWLNEMQEIVGMKLEGTGKVKIHTINGTGLSIAVDWVGRYLYWSELDERDLTSMTSSIYRLDLSQWENGFIHVHKVIRRSRRIQEIEICPFTNTIYWIEINRHGAGHLMKSPADGLALRPLFSIHTDETRRQCNCPENPRIGKTMSLDQTDPYDPVILYSDEWQGQGRLYRTVSNGCQCTIIGSSQKLPPTSITTDHRYVYWSNETENSVYILKQDNKIEEIPVQGVKKIMAIGSHLQPFPSITCLLAKSHVSQPMLLERSARSITLELPKPETLPECENISTPSIQYTIYFGLSSERQEGINNDLECLDSLNLCNVTITYRRIVRIEDLKPYSTYVFWISFKNYYNDLVDVKNIIGAPVMFQTSAGAPSPPRNATVRVLDPTSAEVSWYPPEELNDQSVSYEVRWKTEGTVAGVRQSGEQPVPELPEFYPKDYKSVVIKKLVPGQSYLFWVRAYSRNSQTFSESEGNKIETYPQPKNLTLTKVTPYSLEVSWVPPIRIEPRYYLLYCEYSNCEEWQRVTRFIVVPEKEETTCVKNLTPKTIYRFKIEVVYISSKSPFVWPQDGGFVYETLGDRPSVPGTPSVQQLSRDVYQVVWEKSKDNGAPIQFYLLEGSERKRWLSRRKANYTDVTEDSNKIDSEEWSVYYNGTDNYWIMTELSPSLKYVFRVRAKNRYGWSDSSEKSKSFDFTEAAKLANQQQLGLVLGITLPVIFLGIIFVGIFFFCCLLNRRDKEKKDLQVLTLPTNNRGPDVELATLRELPRRGNFIHNANILYIASTDPPTDEEIKLLPHIRRQQFKLTKFLGSGAFGEVYEGIAQGLHSSTGYDTRVAIKALRKGATEQEKAEFLKEAQLMSHFKHQHILQLLGVCLDNDPNFILMELMEGGDLLSYLRVNRPLINTSNSMTLQDLLAMCVDVAKGCRYLEEMHFVHRDLACRNCLVSSTDPGTRIVKIGDFGLARDIYKNDYYRKEGEGLLPVRWMAPESLVDGVFTSQSDVWAFGVLIWEIMTLGQQPYPARTNVEVLHYVRTGGRLGRPNNCSEELHQLMMKCWSFNPENRPTFKYCLETLENLKERTANAPLTPDISSNYLETRTASQDYSDNKEDEDYGCYGDEKRNSGLSCKKEENDQTVDTQEPEPHRYLELIYDEDVSVSDGYEIPRLPNNLEINLKRTISVSSNASDRSSLLCPPSVSLVESVASTNAEYFSSKNTDLSSLEKLLQNNSVPNGVKCALENEMPNRFNSQTTGNVS